MKHKIMQHVSRCKILFMSICFILVAANLFAATATERKKEIPLHGEWEEDRRSMPIELPVSVTLDGSVLFIQSTSLRSDITVRILDGATVVTEANIPASMLPASLYIEGLALGKTYQLELSNQWGGYLQGSFKIE